MQLQSIPLFLPRCLLLEKEHNIKPSEDKMDIPQKYFENKMSDRWYEYLDVRFKDRAKVNYLLKDHIYAYKPEIYHVGIYKAIIFKSDDQKLKGDIGDTIYFKEYDYLYKSFKKKIIIDNKEVEIIRLLPDQVMFEEDMLVEISEYGDED